MMTFTVYPFSFTIYGHEYTAQKTEEMKIRDTTVFNNTPVNKKTIIIGINSKVCIHITKIEAVVCTKLYYRVYWQIITDNKTFIQKITVHPIMIETLIDQLYTWTKTGNGLRMRTGKMFLSKE